jgi:hypothetical protein
MVQRAAGKELESAVRALVRLTGGLAQHCDRAEHNEQVSREVILATADQLRRLAIDLARTFAVDLRRSYASRLQAIEARHPLGGLGNLDVVEAVHASQTWAGLQRAQILHDLTYHPDVVGLAKFEQLRHYTIHLAKLCGYAQEAVDDEGETLTAFVNLRIADVLRTREEITFQ